jgi:hypothetical protein
MRESGVRGWVVIIEVVVVTSMWNAGRWRTRQSGSPSKSKASDSVPAAPISQRVSRAASWSTSTSLYLRMVTAPRAGLSSITARRETILAASSSAQRKRGEKDSLTAIRHSQAAAQISPTTPMRPSPRYISPTSPPLPSPMLYHPLLQPPPPIATRYPRQRRHRLPLPPPLPTNKPPNPPRIPHNNHLTPH